jgi:hypothetical protein
MKSTAVILLCLASTTLALGQKKVSKYHDGVEMKKGVVFTSFTFSLSDKEAENESTPFVYNVNQVKNSLEVRGDGGYMIKKNLAVGAGLLYGSSKNESLQRSSDGVLTQNRSMERNFAVRPFVKNFLPLGNTKKFYIVIPTELQIGGGTRVDESITNNILTRTYTEATFYGLQMRPGLLAFIVDNFGFEVNVGAFGLSRKKEKISTTGQPDGEVTTGDLDLKINLLQLAFGFAAYF